MVTEDCGHGCGYLRVVKNEECADRVLTGSSRKGRPWWNQRKSGEALRE